MLLCSVEFLPTQRLLLCSFEGAAEGHCSGAGDILLLVIGVERKIKVAVREQFRDRIDP